MAVRLITRQSAASAAVQGIPELPRITAQLLEVPGMLEYDQRLQQWWDNFKRNDVFTQNGTDQKIREVTATSADGLATLTARISTEEIVRAGADSALASRATALEASVDTPTTGLLARVSTIESAYVDASGAYAQAISAITAELSGPSGDIYAAILVESNARSSADSALASRATALEASVDTPTTGLLARVSVIESAYVDASGAYAQAISAITAELSGPSGSIYAAVEVVANAQATTDGFLESRYTINATAGPVVTGMTLYSASGPATEVSEIRFQADRFTIYNGSTGLAPFQVVGSKIRFTGNVEIDGSLIIAGTLTVNYSDVGGTKPPTDADNTEGKLQTGTTITGGGITLSAGGAIKGGASDFSTGTGWFLGYEGGQYKFRVGNPAGPRIEWDGSAWTVVSWPGGGPSYTLTLTASTGNPLDTPTGGGSYTIGTRVNIVAPDPTSAGSFINWTGSDPHMAMVEDLNSANTYVTIIGDMSLIANYP